MQGDDSFRLMYSNTHLKSRETLPLRDGGYGGRQGGSRAAIVSARSASCEIVL